MFLLMMVLDNTTHLTDTLQAWQKAGVRGVTVLESTGLRRLIDPAARGESDSDSAPANMVGHKTIFAVVTDLEMAEKAMRAAEAVTGDLDQPNTGIAFLVPVLAAWGLG